MEKILNPPNTDWLRLTARPAADKTHLEDVVNNVFDAVKYDGDKAVMRFTKEFDKADLRSLRVSESEFTKFAIDLTPELKAAQ